MNILVVDDSELVVKLIKDIFKKKNIKVDGVYSPDKALEKIFSKKYDIFLIDYEVPHMNGLELSREIKKLFPYAKIFIITANSDFKTDEFHVIYKPFDLNELYTIILK